MVALGGYAGIKEWEKGNQDSATPLGNGTTEGLSLGEDVLGSAEEEKRQRGTAELCQTLWLKD